MGKTDLNSDFPSLSIFTYVLGTSTKAAVESVITNMLVD